MKLVSVAEMQAIEAEANAQGLSYEQMMDRAGSGLAEWVRRSDLFWEKGTFVLGLVGGGKNGGDTLIALQRLAEHGWQAHAYLVRSRVDTDPLVQRLRDAGGQLTDAGSDEQQSGLQTLLHRAQVVLDGVLGTGFHPPLNNETESILRIANKVIGAERKKRDLLVVGVDCPSGVDADSGEAAAEVIPANVTVAMAAVKQGLLRMPAYGLVGELQVVDIGLPLDLPIWQKSGLELVDQTWVMNQLPRRPLDAHKGTFGTALIVAGSINFTGAALLAGRAAYQVGAGLVTLAVPAPIHTALAGQLPEATWQLLPHDLGVISDAAVGVVHQAMGNAKSILIGPGWGQEEATVRFLAGLLRRGSPRKRSAGFLTNPATTADPAELKFPPIVVDADALKLLTHLEGWQELLPGPAVLTPHPGEMSVLTGLTTAEVQADRVGLACRCAQEWGHVVVLKGAMTVIAGPDGEVLVVPIATPALARAGTGDVLAGAIAGLLAQGMAPFAAAAAAAWLHARGGQNAAEWVGNSASVLAGDVLAGLVRVLGECLDASAYE